MAGYHLRTKDIFRLRKKQGGWVFIDALIGTVIVVTALTALMAMYTQATRAASANKIYNNALYVAQQQLEDLKQHEGTANMANRLAVSSTTTVDNVKYTVSLEEVDLPAENPVLSARIVAYMASVTWPGNNAPIRIIAYYTN